MANSRGVPHILEHSVLCGSRKYPIKEPFVELMKGSLNTFLNAFTYPDRTCYPVRGGGGGKRGGRTAGQRWRRGVGSQRSSLRSVAPARRRPAPYTTAAADWSVGLNAHRCCCPQ